MLLSSITCQPSIAMQSCLGLATITYTHTNQTQTYAQYMYACTHVYIQRCSVQDHSRVIVEQENVYVMVDQMLCTSLMLMF